MNLSVGSLCEKVREKITLRQNKGAKEWERNYTSVELHTVQVRMA